MIDKSKTIEAMRRYGGSFVKALATAYERADGQNSAALEAAFPDYFTTYGPNGKFQAKEAQVKAKTAQTD